MSTRPPPPLSNRPLLLLPTRPQPSLPTRSPPSLPTRPPPPRPTRPQPSLPTRPLPSLPTRPPPRKTTSPATTISSLLTLRPPLQATQSPTRVPAVTWFPPPQVFTFISNASSVSSAQGLVTWFPPYTKLSPANSSTIAATSETGLFSTASSSLAIPPVLTKVISSPVLKHQVRTPTSAATSLSGSPRPSIITWWPNYEPITVKRISTSPSSGDLLVTFTPKPHFTVQKNTILSPPMSSSNVSSLKPSAVLLVNNYPSRVPTLWNNPPQDTTKFPPVRLSEGPEGEIPTSASLTLFHDNIQGETQETNKPIRLQSPLTRPSPRPTPPVTLTIPPANSQAFQMILKDMREEEREVMAEEPSAAPQLTQWPNTNRRPSVGLLTGGMVVKENMPSFVKQEVSVRPEKQNVVSLFSDISSLSWPMSTTTAPTSIAATSTTSATTETDLAANFASTSPYSTSARTTTTPPSITYSYTSSSRITHLLSVSPKPSSLGYNHTPVSKSPSASSPGIPEADHQNSTHHIHTPSANQEGNVFHDFEYNIYEDDLSEYYTAYGTMGDEKIHNLTGVVPTSQNVGVSQPQFLNLQVLTWPYTVAPTPKPSLSLQTPSPTPFSKLDEDNFNIMTETNLYLQDLTVLPQHSLPQKTTLVPRPPWSNLFYSLFYTPQSGFLQSFALTSSPFHFDSTNGFDGDHTLQSDQLSGGGVDSGYTEYHNTMEAHSLPPPPSRPNLEKYLTHNSSATNSAQHLQQPAPLGITNTEGLPVLFQDPPKGTPPYLMDHQGIKGAEALLSIASHQYTCNSPTSDLIMQSFGFLDVHHLIEALPLTPANSPPSTRRPPTIYTPAFTSGGFLGRPESQGHKGMLPAPYMNTFPLPNPLRPAHSSYLGQNTDKATATPHLFHGISSIIEKDFNTPSYSLTVVSSNPIPLPASTPVPYHSLSASESAAPNKSEVSSSNGHTADGNKTGQDNNNDDNSDDNNNNNNNNNNNSNNNNNFYYYYHY